jgi:RNA polymerase sigma factor (sigma-70 family)
MSGVIRHLRRTVLLRDGARLTDEELLTDYISRRDEAALAALVHRHGPMVWGVCRRVLRNYHDAEDAFQATFLVFVRKGASIASRELLANWLYGVAHHTALKARATAARRKGRERQVLEMPEPAVAEQDLWRDLQPLLDEELSRLPDKYRVVIVLCDLEGKTRKEAARQLACPEGTVAGRLARARVMLAKRLARRGIGLSGGALAALVSQNVALAAVPASVVSSTIKAASLLAAGQAAGVVTAKVAALTEGVVQAMFTTKIKSVLAVVLVVGFALAGAGLLYRTPAAEQPPDSGKVVQAPKPGEKEAPAPALPDEKTAPKEQKVLTSEEALKLRSKEKVTVQFKVVGVDVGANQAHLRGFYLGPRIFLNGDNCSAVLAPPVQQTIHRLGIDPVKHFTGKVIRVTGVVVQNAPQGPGCYIVVHDLNQFTVVRE